jgi:ABC-type transport system involved in multi-copper enzyme maturation permease subunit
MLDTAQNLTAAPRAEGSALAHTWRLVRWEVFLARRRAMSKVLAGILLGGYLLIVGFIVLAYVTTLNRGASEVELQPIRDLLTFPGSLVVGGIYAARLAPLLVCILSGALIGSEYGFSTQRLAFARGVGRGQMLTAQVTALGIVALAISVGSLLLAALVGVTIGPAVGGTISGPAQGSWQEIGTYTLVLSLILWIYSLLALFFATLGRSVAAGIGLALGWLFIVDNVLTSILQLLGTIPGDFFRFIAHIPDWLLGVNTSVLKVATSNSPLQFGVLDAGPNTSGSPLNIYNPVTALPAWHALLVIFGYAAVLVGVSYWLLRTRDVTD